MVKISIFRDKDKYIKGYTIRGHANFGKSGKDMVCSAVSAVAYTGVGSLLNMAGGCDYIDNSGDMKCFLKEDISEEHHKIAQIILKSTYIGFMQIRESYGKYVMVQEEEV